MEECDPSHIKLQESASWMWSIHRKLSTKCNISRNVYCKQFCAQKTERSLPMNEIIRRNSAHWTLNSEIHYFENFSTQDFKTWYTCIKSNVGQQTKTQEYAKMRTRINGRGLTFDPKDYIPAIILLENSCTNRYEIWYGDMYISILIVFPHCLSRLDSIHLPLDSIIGHIASNIEAIQNFRLHPNKHHRRFCINK